jgi:hypothetical protein
MKLHTYGDSHASEWGAWNKLDIPGLEVVINHIQGKLMYSFGRDRMIVVGNITDGDMVVFCFGEIDCRCHINKYEPYWEQTIDEIVKKYFETIAENVKYYPATTVFVYNVVPPLERELPENFHTEIGNLLPSIGTDRDRREYTEYMNYMLSNYCERYGYVFFNVYDKYVNEKGFLSTEYSDGNCHIKNPVFMREFLLNFLKK